MYYVLPVVLSISSKSPVLHDAYAALVSLTWFCVYSGSVHPIPWQWFSAHHHGSTPLHCKISNKDQIIPPTKAIRTVLLWPAFWLLWNSTTMAFSGEVISLPGLLPPIYTWNPRTWVNRPKVQAVYGCINHGNCNISLAVNIGFSARDTIFPAVKTWLSWLFKELFVAGSIYYWSEAEVWTKIVAQSAYTSAIEWLQLKWNGCDCDILMHVAVGLYFCHVTMF